MRKRTFMRVNVNWSVEMESMLDRKKVTGVKVLTFSNAGLSFRCDKEIQVGESFVIDLPFASIPISVVRRLDDRYGALFLNISLEEIELIKENLYKDDGGSILMEAISQF
ncbi:type IV pilus assembly PilZ [Desulforamulus reducens MI-1]|uniref:Type IV pilus assembly PilZ n=1 Tax=Desulforamulus reducens (strain ATCC BAA-1160 / DSM 100696 / MI-1) TaxID=349161 RepID=A4J1M8_DESRM|nr:PilZ domain-containing protein [Desulforamulus reducens]ABO48981.1 type IV pilus assembly PilZ [Desulforamulus reducens MI-1]